MLSNHEYAIYAQLATHNSAQVWQLTINIAIEEKYSFYCKSQRIISIVVELQETITDCIKSVTKPAIVGLPIMTKTKVCGITTEILLRFCDRFFTINK